MGLALLVYDCCNCLYLPHCPAGYRWDSGRPAPTTLPTGWRGTPLPTARLYWPGTDVRSKAACMAAHTTTSASITFQKSRRYEQRCKMMPWSTIWRPGGAGPAWDHCYRRRAIDCINNRRLVFSDLPAHVPGLTAAVADTELHCPDNSRES